MALSPMMQQYLDIQKEYPGCILFFRLGDFYEMFFEQAKLVSRLLELVLTGKSCGLEERAPMCGIPFHAADSYIAKLVGMGYKVAVCEQLEDPQETKGMVKRGVVRVVTPGTVTSGAMLKEKENNYLACCYIDRDGMSVSSCDISTGELKTTEKIGQDRLLEEMLSELNRIGPKEILLPGSLLEMMDEEEIARETGAYISTVSDTEFAEKTAREAIRTQFGAVSLTTLGIDGREYSIRSIGALLSYLFETQKQELGQLRSVRYYDIGSSMSLDRATLRNLEITETLFERKLQGSLLGVLDKTETAMGARLLKNWLREPLKDHRLINDRLDAVEELVREPYLRNDLKYALREVYDFERLMGRIASGNANGRDMIALMHSLAVLPEIKGLLADSPSALLSELCSRIADLEEVRKMIEEAVTEDPPLTITNGELIKSGYSEELDAIKDSIRDAKLWIAGLEKEEKDRTGITHLKVGFNKVFGYYIEVSRSNLDLVPEDYIRKQTLVGAERFITPKLKEMEGIVLNAETRINKLEYELFTALRKEVSSQIREIQTSSAAVAAIDALLSYAQVSSGQGYVRPDVDAGMVIDIRGGRHPVIEQMTGSGLFVSNDTYLNDNDSSMLIITGPNMSGKSTYMRQTALIVLMAQAGCFVPAESARIGVTDRMFTRIGASDNLAQGQSTFFVEMSELAYILRNAEKRSLIILDEIGRGTSTYDGLSIAWSTADYLCNEKRKIRTLFATHYHELTQLEDKVGGVRNLNVDVAEENGDIVFLHKIIPGSASRSYGIHVARLAGIPGSLLEEAEERLEALEEGSRERSSALPEKKKKKEAEPQPLQLSFFREKTEPALEKLRNLDLMEITPSGAIRILEELKELVD